MNPKSFCFLYVPSNKFFFGTFPKISHHIDVQRYLFLDPGTGSYLYWKHANISSLHYPLFVHFVVGTFNGANHDGNKALVRDTRQDGKIPQISKNYKYVNNTQNIIKTQ